jgi:hypothetical protein
MKMPEKTETEFEENFSQRERPEVGRFILQVDRQTKGSYPTAETAFAAGLAMNAIITKLDDEQGAWPYAQSGHGRDARPDKHQYRAHLAATRSKARSAV